MLLIGAGERNVGKTELACTLVAKAAALAPVTGVKVTIVERSDGVCPHGNTGCTACSLKEAPFCVSEEQAPPPGKDTARLREAGAARVLWLRAREDALAAGAAALFERVGPGAVCVAESNRLRHVVEPGLFLLVRRRGSAAMKSSAAGVAALADCVVESDGQAFDPPPGSFFLQSGAWTMRREACALVLAGGSSRRAGTDKSLFEIDGEPLIKRVVDQLRPLFAQILVSTNTPEAHAFLGLPMIPDLQPGRGPLMALASCLPHARHERVFTVCCDMPEVPPGLVSALFRRLGDVDGVVPVGPDGRREPLFALYLRDPVLAAARNALQAGRQKVLAIEPACRLADLRVPPAARLANLNTRAEIDEWIRGRPIPGP